MEASGNGKASRCASNLLRIVRGEVPYERVKGRDGSLIDKPDAQDDAIADIKWLLETYEPRVDTDNIEIVATDGENGDFHTEVSISKKEAEE